MGNYEKGETNYKKTIDICYDSLGGNHPTCAIYLNNLATHYEARKMYREALKTHFEALRVTENSVGEQHPDYGIRLINIAPVYYRLEQLDSAMFYQEKARENILDVYGEKHPHYGFVVNGLAVLNREMGYDRVADSLFTIAVRSVAEEVGKRHIWYSTFKTNHARLMWCLDSVNLADEYFHDSYQSQFEGVRTNLSLVSDSEGEAFINGITKNFQSPLSFYCEFGREYPMMAKSAFDIELATKGLLLNSSIRMRKIIANSGDSALIDSFDQLLMQKGVRASLPYSLVSRSEIVNGLDFRIKSLESHLKKKSEVFSQASQIGEVRWNDVKKN